MQGGGDMAVVRWYGDHKVDTVRKTSLSLTAPQTPTRRRRWVRGIWVTNLFYTEVNKPQRYSNQCVPDLILPSSGRGRSALEEAVAEATRDRGRSSGALTAVVPSSPHNTISSSSSPPSRLLSSPALSPLGLLHSTSSPQQQLLPAPNVFHAIQQQQHFLPSTSTHLISSTNFLTSSPSSVLSHSSPAIRSPQLLQSPYQSTPGMCTVSCPLSSTSTCSPSHQQVLTPTYTISADASTGSLTSVATVITAPPTASLFLNTTTTANIHYQMQQYNHFQQQRATLASINAIAVSGQTVPVTATALPTTLSNVVKGLPLLPKLMENIGASTTATASTINSNLNKMPILAPALSPPGRSHLLTPAAVGTVVSTPKATRKKRKPRWPGLPFILPATWLTSEVTGSPSFCQPRDWQARWPWLPFILPARDWQARWPWLPVILLATWLTSE